MRGRQAERWHYCKGQRPVAHGAWLGACGVLSAPLLGGSVSKISRGNCSLLPIVFSGMRFYSLMSRAREPSVIISSWFFPHSGRRGRGDGAEETCLSSMLGFLRGWSGGHPLRAP